MVMLYRFRSWEGLAMERVKIALSLRMLPLTVSALMTLAVLIEMVWAPRTV